MKELISIIALSFMFVCANAQNTYFSNEPLIPGVIPAKSKCKTQFTDNEFIYGMIHFKKNLEALGVKKATSATALDGSTYQFSTLDLSYQFGNIPVAMVTGRAYAQPLIEIDGESYLMLTILPNSEDCFYMQAFPECMSNLYSDGIMASTMNMAIKSFDYGELKFSTKIKITRKKKNEEGKKYLRDLKTACYENKNRFDQDRLRSSQNAENEQVTYEEVQMKLVGGFGPACSAQIQLKTKKKGEDFTDWTSAWKGFEFSGENCKIENGYVYINPLPFGANLNEQFSVTAKNQFNENCMVTVTQKLDYSGEFYFNYSGANGKKGAKKEFQGGNGGDGIDAYDLDVYITDYKSGYLLVKFVWAKNGQEVVYIFKNDGTTLHVNNRGGNGGGAGMGYGNPQIHGKGGDGGNGAKVTIHIDPSVKDFSEKIIVDNRGGDGGYKIAGNSGNAGQAGQSGPKSKVIVEPVKINVP